MREPCARHAVALPNEQDRYLLPLNLTPFKLLRFRYSFVPFPQL
jgi:hypothetical protein